ncbi:hypothetical protein T492DRAFT_863416 [Pavlovales sp. CCMP2436]|nr:hypothetical protein T492DRAFT_863416 [Pavlovales sp. CCMP2436]
MSKRKGAKRQRIKAEIEARKISKVGGPRSKLAARAAPSPLEPVMPYRAGKRVLVLGDGDLSWSRALAALRGATRDGGAGIAATSYDSYEEALRKGRAGWL